jgi:hypothetical protein
MKEKEISKFTPEEIIEDLETNFPFISKPFAKYCNETSTLWTRCLGIVRDVEMMNHIVFCNDYLQIPPSHAVGEILSDVELTAYDKKFIGAFWGHVFNSFGYKESGKLGAKKRRIKTALYYMDNDEKVVVVPTSKTRSKKKV